MSPGSKTRCDGSEWASDSRQTGTDETVTGKIRLRLGANFELFQQIVFQFQVRGSKPGEPREHHVYGFCFFSKKLVDGRHGQKKSFVNFRQVDKTIFQVERACSSVLGVDNHAC